MLDFAVAIYDRQVRLLAQAPSLPLFMGTMNFCVEAAVEAVGGEEALEPGDIILYNYPYGTGSHPQDAAVVMPVFLHDEELIGYTTIKGHWLDIGGKEPYSTDTVDVFQEGTIFPGVKLYSRGELVDDIYRMALANSRVPKMVAGDINAEVVGVRTAAAALLRLVERYGLETFQQSVERMFDHGEAVVRSYFEKLPDGRYVGQGDDGQQRARRRPGPVRGRARGRRLDRAARLLERARTRRPGRSTARSRRPSRRAGSRSRCSQAAASRRTRATSGRSRSSRGPARCSTRARRRPASSTAGRRCRRWRSSTTRSRRRCRRPCPPAAAATSARSSGGACARTTGEPWADGSPHPVGQGASVHGDGANSLHAPRRGGDALLADRGLGVEEPVAAREGRAGARLGRRRPPPRRPRRRPLLPGARGHVRHGSAVERTKTPPWGLEGGDAARAERRRAAHCPTARARYFGKATRLLVPKGATLELYNGGGGGYGDPAERDPEAVHADIREGYFTEEFSRQHYPHAFE